MMKLCWQLQNVISLFVTCAYPHSVKKTILPLTSERYRECARYDIYRRVQIWYGFGVKHEVYTIQSQCATLAYLKLKNTTCSTQSYLINTIHPNPLW